MHSTKTKKSNSHFQRPVGILSDFWRYVSGGVGAVLTDFTVFILLTHGGGLHPVMANTVSRPLGGLVSFTANRHWTFRGRGKAALHVQFVRFWIVWGLSFMLTEALIWIFHDGFHWSPVISKLGAEGMAGLFNFLMQRHWTFR